jgi:hypothetical protein
MDSAINNSSAYNFCCGEKHVTGPEQGRWSEAMGCGRIALGSRLGPELRMRHDMEAKKTSQAQQNL